MSLPMPQNDSLENAIETFANAVAFTRCFTYPSIAERVGPLWVIRDAARSRSADYRREEYAAWDIEPAEVNAIARRHTTGRFCVCAIHAKDESDTPLRAGYKELGYRLTGTEAIMAHPLKRIEKCPAEFPIQQVRDADHADLVAKAAGRRQILPEHLSPDAPLRLYVALDGKKAVGWLRSITVGRCTWVSNVHVISEYRRRGIGKSLMEKMMRDDRRHGSKASVLTASHTGELLYNRIGYQTLGTLMIFVPRKN